jgi:chemotaxis protein CheC
MDLTELQLDALREMANIGSGNAATALASMLGRPVDLNVPSASALPLADAVEAVGDVTAEVTAVAIPVTGDLCATVLMTFKPSHAATLCGFLGVAGDPEMELSALQEIGNILGSAYISAMGTMCGLQMEPAPPMAAVDMLGAIVASVLATAASSSDLALLLDSSMIVEGAECEFGFLFVPDENGVSGLLARLGLWEEDAA